MSYRSVRKELAKQADGDGGDTSPENQLLPCRFCGEPTKRKVLSELGARCRTCYDAYCREGIQPRRQAQTALPRTQGRVNVMPDRTEPASAGPEHAVEALPFD
jgi:hypothetical protein